MSNPVKARITESLKKRLWEKINKNGPPHSRALGRCWIWMGTTVTAGYGQISDKNKKVAVHRALWMLFYGMIPNGICVLHKCDNPPCCNPRHLFLGTHGDNAKDREAKGRGVNLCGQAAPWTKLKDSDVIGIKKMLATGFSQAEIAGKYLVSQQHISKINNGERRGAGRAPCARRQVSK